jgi:hypothetical protein
MVCPICGPEPARVIFDGITLAFSRKHLTETLKPPTSVDEFSPVRRSKQVKRQMALPDRALRALIRRVIAGPLIVTEKNTTSAKLQHSDDSDGDEPTGGPASKLLKEEIERVRAVPRVLEGLYLVNASLGSLFQKYFGEQNLESGQKIPGELVSLFREVGLKGIVKVSGLTSTKIAAEESLLQMIPNPAIKVVQVFNENR